MEKSLKKIIITIDGPAGSGKGKIASYLSKKWKLYHIDSGILYRGIASIILKNNINHLNENDILKILKTKPKISFRNLKKLRNEEISLITSHIATYRSVRNYINQIQRDFVIKYRKKRGFVIDGRDIGSVVFKSNADLKLFIQVDSKIRAKRRYKQLIEMGEKSIYQKILKDINLRDKKDKQRMVSPLVIPRGSIVINNNGNLKETLRKINVLVGAII